MIFEENPSPLQREYSWEMVTFAVCFGYDSTDCLTQEHKDIMSVAEKRQDQSSIVYG